MDQTEETGQRQVGGRQWNSLLDINCLLLWDETQLFHIGEKVLNRHICVCLFFIIVIIQASRGSRDGKKESCQSNQKSLSKYLPVLFLRGFYLLVFIPSRQQGKRGKKAE